MTPARRVFDLVLAAILMMVAGLRIGAGGGASQSRRAGHSGSHSLVGRRTESSRRAAWRHAAHFSIAYEINPGHNIPAPASTQVDAGYTADALWLRFQAQDPHPGDIGARYREHDDMASYADDFVGVMLSPFNDTQWAYELFCTAGGTEWDAFRQQNNEYSSWDAVWTCHASRTANGYQVIMKIPFASIKFPHSAEPTASGDSSSSATGRATSGTSSSVRR